jgi:hypothetical protein
MHAHRGQQLVGEAFVGIMAIGARDGVIDRQAWSKNRAFPSATLSEVCAL